MAFFKALAAFLKRIRGGSSRKADRDERPSRRSSWRWSLRGRKSKRKSLRKTRSEEQISSAVEDPSTLQTSVIVTSETGRDRDPADVPLVVDLEQPPPAPTAVKKDSADVVENTTAESGSEKVDENVHPESEKQPSHSEEEETSSQQVEPNVDQVSKDASHTADKTELGDEISSHGLSSGEVVSAEESTPAGGEKGLTGDSSCTEVNSNSVQSSLVEDKPSIETSSSTIQPSTEPCSFPVNADSEPVSSEQSVARDDSTVIIVDTDTQPQSSQNSSNAEESAEDASGSKELIIHDAAFKTQDMNDADKLSQEQSKDPNESSEPTVNTAEGEAFTEEPITQDTSDGNKQDDYKDQNRDTNVSAKPCNDTSSDANKDDELAQDGSSETQQDMVEGTESTEDVIGIDQQVHSAPTSDELIENTQSEELSQESSCKDSLTENIDKAEEPVVITGESEGLPPGESTEYPTQDESGGDELSQESSYKDRAAENIDKAEEPVVIAGESERLPPGEGTEYPTQDESGGDISYWGTNNGSKLTGDDELVEEEKHSEVSLQISSGGDEHAEDANEGDNLKANQDTSNNEDLIQETTGGSEYERVAEELTQESNGSHEQNQDTTEGGQDTIEDQDTIEGGQDTIEDQDATEGDQDTIKDQDTAEGDQDTIEDQNTIEGDQDTVECNQDTTVPEETTLEASDADKLSADPTIGVENSNYSEFSNTASSNNRSTMDRSDASDGEDTTALDEMDKYERDISDELTLTTAGELELIEDEIAPDQDTHESDVPTKDTNGDNTLAQESSDNEKLMEGPSIVPEHPNEKPSMELDSEDTHESDAPTKDTNGDNTLTSDNEELMGGPSVVPEHPNEKPSMELDSVPRPPPETGSAMVEDEEDPRGEVYSRAKRLGVALEDQEKSADGRTVTGTILVHNECYEKNVGVHYSMDSWESYKDSPAAWVESVEGEDLDRFKFIIELCTEESYCMEMAIYCNKYWDNNSGNNYIVIHDADK